MNNGLVLEHLVASTMKQYVTASFNAKLYYAEDASTGGYVRTRRTSRSRRAYRVAFSQ